MHSQVVRLSVEGDVVQVHVEVRVVLAAHPADGRAVEGGARAHVRLQAGQHLRLLRARVDFWDLKGQELGGFVVAAEGQRRPGGSERRRVGLESGESLQSKLSSSSTVIRPHCVTCEGLI